MTVLFSSNGFPDQPALERLANFRGSPQDYVGYAQSLFWQENTDNGEYVDDRGHHMHYVNFRTGGWSGHDIVLDTIQRSLFHIAYWFRSERGGLHVYHIPGTDWLHNRGFWGSARSPEPV